jgi:hypothetical protein
VVVTYIHKVFVCVVVVGKWSVRSIKSYCHGHCEHSAAEGVRNSPNTGQHMLLPFLLKLD